MTGYVPEKPHPKQHAFLALNSREAFFGGAAGGGKSAALLIAALQYVDVPGYSAVILRKTHAQLAKADSILHQAHAWLKGTDARWTGSKNRYTFPSGATLEFGHLQHPNDKYNYQGAAFQFIGFDELTQFLEEEYRYLFSRLRKKTEGAIGGVPLRMRSASNPGGLGHLWVRSRFIRREVQAGDEEAGTLDDDGRVRRGERVFIPSALSDNPSLDEPSYVAQLMELDPQTRKQLLEGDWDVREPGACFTEFIWGIHTVEGTRLPESNWPVVKMIDFGIRNAVCLYAEVIADKSAFVFAEVHSVDKNLHAFCEDILKMDQEFELDTAQTTVFCDPAGQARNSQTSKPDVEVLQEYDMPVRGLEDRYDRAYRTSFIKRLLSNQQLFFSRDWCPYTTEAFQRAIWDRIGTGGAWHDYYKKDGTWDHPLDALGEGMARIFPPFAPASAETAPSGVYHQQFQYSGSEFG